MRIVLSVDPLCKLEIETAPGEQLPPIVAAMIGGRHFRLDVLGETPAPLDVRTVLRAGEDHSDPADDPTELEVPHAPAGDIRIEDFEQWQPGSQCVS